MARMSITISEWVSKEVRGSALGSKWCARWLVGWVCGWMCEWLNGWMDKGGWMDESVGGWVSLWVDGWVCRWSIDDYYPSYRSIMIYSHHTWNGGHPHMLNPRINQPLIDLVTDTDHVMRHAQGSYHLQFFSRVHLQHYTFHYEIVIECIPLVNNSKKLIERDFQGRKTYFGCGLCR